MGPTASGKSSLALHLAQRFAGEIVSADSAQVYRGVDIGTAKASLEEQSIVPHHLVDILTLADTFSLADFQRLALDCCTTIWQVGHLPIIVGGTGLYIRGFLEGYTLIELQPDPVLRRSLEKRDLDDLLLELQQLDPQGYATIDKCNKRRVVRALEVTIQSGRPFSQCSQRRKPDLCSLKIAIDIPVDILNQRIEQRCRAMISQGWLEEVNNLVKKGQAGNLRRLRILGYSELLDAVEGACAIAEASERIVTATKRFAKRQRTWLRAEPDVHWITYGDYMQVAAEQLVASFVKC